MQYENHYYSVPHYLVKQKVEVQASANTVVVYYRGERIASHPRSYRQGRHSTCTEHMPGNHRAIAEWSPERFLSWAGDIGDATRKLVQHLLQENRHQEQSYRRILALLSNAKKYGRERLNNACERALNLNSPTRSSVESILKQGLDMTPLPPQSEAAQHELNLDHHENIRGEHYYH